MNILSIEHGRTAYHADFALYGTAVLGLGAWLALRAPAPQRLELAAWVGAGVVAWSPIEYALHRFVLHGVQPFKRWHLQHHRHPTALISTPTVVSAALFGAGVWLPARWWLGIWVADAFTLGLLIGYLAYATTHHALHHWQSDMRWLQNRKYWHARHHHLLQPCCFGVTSGFWDWALRTAGHKIPQNPPIKVRRFNG